MSELRDDFADTADAALAASDAALDRGDVRQARELALSVLNNLPRNDLAREAQALQRIAHCDRIESKLRRASETARRAAQIYEQLGDARGEASSLAILTHVCMLLGRNEEALEAALLGVRLCEHQVAQPHAVIAHNCLGLAYAWAGDHGRADIALDEAARIARECVPPASVYQPRLNQVWVEASRLMDARYQTGHLGNLERLEALLAECHALERDGHNVAMVPGLRAMARSISLASTALVTVWRGDLPGAQAAIAEARASLSGEPTWLDSFVHWCEAELAWSRADWREAERAFERMKETALAVEHEQLACRAHLLLTQVFEIQDKQEAARAEYRALRIRERRVVVEGMQSRESLVSWRLGARRSERHLQQALIASKQFERWSLEDALTGIGNRRHFEQSLVQRLAALEQGGPVFTLAMVDVDKFKLVNDRYTHQVGDRVLKTVAAIMSSVVREVGDLTARWAGDEFVILFARATLVDALQICERLRDAVSGFDWEAVAPGLKLTVSVGLSEARAGDTVESVFRRSDESMYQAKSAAAPSSDEP